MPEEQREAFVDPENSDSAAMVLLVKFLYQDVMMATNALEHARDQIKPLMENVELRAREFNRAQGFQQEVAFDRALQILDRYAEDATVTSKEQLVQLVRDNILQVMRET